MPDTHPETHCIIAALVVVLFTLWAEMLPRVVVMAAEVQCPRCKVSVPVEKIDIPNRCPSKDCPLNAKDTR